MQCGDSRLGKGSRNSVRIKTTQIVKIVEIFTIGFVFFNLISKNTVKKWEDYYQKQLLSQPENPLH